MKQEHNNLPAKQRKLESNMFPKTFSGLTNKLQKRSGYGSARSVQNWPEESPQIKQSDVCQCERKYQEEHRGSESVKDQTSPESKP